MIRVRTIIIAFSVSHVAMAAGASESDEAAMRRVRSEIAAMIAPGLCRNLVHCRLLPLGLSPCGGPTQYLAYSSGLGDPAALETKAAEYAFLEEEVRNKKSSADKCVPLPAYQAVCIDNRCRAQPVGQSEHDRH